MGKKSRVNSHEEKSERNNKENQKQQEIPAQQEKFSLYLFLQVDKNATSDQIKKQYRKLVLKYHPDKNQGDQTAKQKFQRLKQAFDILSDPQKRKIYDETGTYGSEEQFNQKSFQSAYDYFRAMFKKVTVEDIQDFQKKYRFGPMEEEDLLNYYEQNSGNMVQLIESIPLSTNQDIPRFIKFFQDKIEQKAIQKYKDFAKTKNKVRLLKDQTQEFEEMEKQKKKQSLNELTLAIRSKRQNQHYDFIAALEQKFGGGKKKKAEKEQKPPKRKPKNV